MSISKDTRDKWRAEAVGQRHYLTPGSGRSIDNNRLVATLDALDEAEAALGACRCDTNPATTEGPSQDCPRHGRPYEEWVEYAQQAGRDAADLRSGSVPCVNGSRRSSTSGSATGISR